MASHPDSAAFRCSTRWCCKGNHGVIWDLSSRIAKLPCDLSCYRETRLMSSACNRTSASKERIAAISARRVHHDGRANWDTGSKTAMNCKVSLALEAWARFTGELIRE